MPLRRSKIFYKSMRSLIRDQRYREIEPILTSHVKNHGLVGGTMGKILVNYLCVKRSVESAIRVIKKLKEQQKTVNVAFPVDVIGILVRRGAVLDAYRLVMGARDDLPLMDVVDYGIVIDGLCKGGYVDKALDLCGFAMKKGIEVNIVVYNIVLNGLCHQGCLVDAFRLFDSLERNGVVASDVTYGTMIDGLVREWFVLDARELFERMVSKGVKANTHIYNSLIDGYCKIGYVGEGLRLAREMEDGGCEPDEFTVSSVIYGYCREGELEAALQFFDSFKRKGVFPDFLGFLHLIRGLCAKGRMEESRTVMREMLQCDSVLEIISKIDLEIETAAIDCLHHLCEQGSIREALVVLTEIGNMFFPYKRILPTCSRSKSISCDKAVNKRALTLSFVDDISSDLGSSSRSKPEKFAESFSNKGEFEPESQLPEFDVFYSQLKSLCSDGHLQEASELAKEVISKLAKH